MEILKSKLLKDLNFCARHLFQDKPVVWKSKYMHVYHQIHVKQTAYGIIFGNSFESNNWPWVLQNAEPDLPPLASHTLHLLRERINLESKKRVIIDHIPVIVMSHIPLSETYEKIKILTFPLLLEKSIFSAAEIAQQNKSCSKTWQSCLKIL